MKLLAKTAEERYQTAVGLERDLQRVSRNGNLVDASTSSPGEHDTPDRLLIPEKLYGRASEINTLLASFDRVVGGGRPELVLVSGYSGVGKSRSSMNCINRSSRRAAFLHQASSTSTSATYRMRPSRRPSRASSVQSWRRTKKSWAAGAMQSFREALGPNGQLMVDLVPELKLIIGEQQPVPELPPQDAQSRFQLVFRRFIGVFTREHPLALFLDDLQWLDAATLDLMEDLLTHPDVKHLMLIGAYRDNEVAPRIR
jgi:Cdc6-like AAA superfamily ATPase